jgi:hypothetical protein
MKHYGLLELNFWVSIIAMGMLVTACGAGGSPTASGLNASPTAAGPQLSLRPSEGMPNTQVIVEGSGFPEQVRVRIGLSPQDTPRHITYIGEVSSDDKGHFSILYVVPDIWPDGSPVDDAVLTFSAITLDEQVKANADFHDLSSLAPAMTARANQTSTPTHLATSSVPSASVTDMADAESPRNTATRSPNGNQPAMGTSAPFVDASSPIISDSIKTSVDFLYSFLHDPTGASSTIYLSQRLRADIENNWALPTGLGIQPGYNSFEVVLLSKNDESVMIQASLTYETGASLRNFTLIKEEDHWRIDQIVAGSR